MTVRFYGRKNQRRSGIVICGGPATTSGGCGRGRVYSLPHALTDKVAEIALTERAIKDGWTSDFPSWTSAMVGHSHLCPACTKEAKNVE